MRSLLAFAAVSLMSSCSPKGPCPKEMALVPGTKACMDRFEASLEGGEKGDREGKGTTAKAVAKQGAVPAVQVSWLQARAACANAGKRLCTRAEWLSACKGADGKRKFSYGDAYVPERCADRPLARRLGEKPQPAGALPECKNPEGVYDLSGNVWEWLSDTAEGGGPADLIGGGYGNEGRSLACAGDERLGQPITQQAEALGFRCCRDAAPGK